MAAMCGAIVPLLLGCVAGQRALAMDVEVVPLCGGKWELRNRPSSSAYVEVVMEPAVRCVCTPSALQGWSLR